MFSVQDFQNDQRPTWYSLYSLQSLILKIQTKNLLCLYFIFDKFFKVGEQDKWNLLQQQQQQHSEVSDDSILRYRDRGGSLGSKRRRISESPPPHSILLTVTFTHIHIQAGINTHKMWSMWQMNKKNVKLSGVKEEK